ncbi:MAG: nucleotidyl transferase AbiEii/AbiGii toxin family protein [Acidiferrobacterales bacterium]|nr:nucleotidyl transferase AbiEii/AbiGii toxin family protein [Acidiferrobacterales bacterium]
MNVDASFIEKDYYATKVVQAIAKCSHSKIEPVFCGGTSLSKGYGILNRFSEDVDFRAQFNVGTTPTKSIRRSFRREICSLIESVEGITPDMEQMETGGDYFKIPLMYPQFADVSSALRPHLKLDFSYTQPRLKPQSLPISSFLTEFSNNQPDTRILCLAPLETAADKFSALVWRVNKTSRSDEHYGPAMIRHLHDLYFLRNYVFSQCKDFREMVHASFEADNKRFNRFLGMALREAIEQMLGTLSKDGSYEAEYEHYVLSMSYARSQELARFDAAIDCLKKLSRIFQIDTDKTE